MSESIGTTGALLPESTTFVRKVDDISKKNIFDVFDVLSIFDTI